MRKNAFKAVDHIKELNSLKKETLKEGAIRGIVLQEKLKSCGLPSSPNFWIEFKNSGLLIVVERGYFAWANPEPIHFKVLEEIYSRYIQKARGYMKTTQLKVVAQNRLHDNDIQKAIELLKKNGFEVFMPCAKMYRKLQVSLLIVTVPDFQYVMLFTNFNIMYLEVGNFLSSFALRLAGIVQWLECQTSNLNMRVRFPLPALCQ